MVRQPSGFRSCDERHLVEDMVGKSGPAIEVDSADLRRALRQIGDKGLTKELAQANKTAAQVVVDVALPRVPVRSGRLRAAVRALGSQKEGRAVAGSARVPYAAAIHWGRKRGGVIQGRPFLSDAAEAASEKAADVYLEAVDGLLDKIRRS